MQQLPNSPVRIQFGLRGWAAIVAGLAILGVIAFLAVGLLIFLLPVLLLSTVLYWFLPKPKRSSVFPAEKPPGAGTTIIDGNFRVIERDPGPGQ
jgi:hypothetical protein